MRTDSRIASPTPKNGFFWTVVMCLEPFSFDKLYLPGFIKSLTNPDEYKLKISRYPSIKGNFPYSRNTTRESSTSFQETSSTAGNDFGKLGMFF